MIGMNRNTGREISDIEHLKQSLRDLLTTAKGTRIMRADYGSNLPRLIDMPVNNDLILDIISETADAIDKWEPRIKVTQVNISEITQGSVILSITGKYLPNGKTVTVDGILVE